MREITEKTLIPISLVISIIGAAVWLTVIYAKVEAAEVMNQKQEIKFDAQLTLLNDIRDRLIRVEEKSKQGCK